MNLQEVERLAMDLPPTERGRLAAALLDSVGPTIQGRTEELAPVVLDELRRRLAAHQSGDAGSIAAEDVQRGMREKYGWK